MENKPNEHLSAAVLIEENEKLLLVRQAEGKGIMWGPPAGHLEPEETFSQAAIRETHEETGLMVKLTSLVGIYTYLKLGQLKTGVVFRGKVLSGELRQLVADITECRWFSQDEVQELLRDNRRLYKPEYNLRCMADWLAGVSFPLNALKESP